MGRREALAYNMRRQWWETGCMVKVPMVRQGKKLHSGVLNKINSKKEFLKIKKGINDRGRKKQTAY